MCHEWNFQSSDIPMFRVQCRFEDICKRFSVKSEETSFSTEVDDEEPQWKKFLNAHLSLI